MDDAGWQPLRREMRRTAGARRHQDTEIFRCNALDQRNDGRDLANARPVDPNQWARRARDGAFAAPLQYAFRIFLAALEPMRDKDACERRRRAHERAIGVECQGQRLCLDRPLDDPIRQHATTPDQPAARLARRAPANLMAQLQAGWGTTFTISPLRAADSLPARSGAGD